MFVVLAACAAYGFIHERLLAQPLWTPDGQTRFIAFSAVYWAIACGFLLFATRWLGPVAAVIATAYTIWWAGPIAPLAALYFFGSCFCLGRIVRRDANAPASILLGLAAWMFVIWLALHFPINTPTVYAFAMAIPYLIVAPTWTRRNFTLIKPSPEGVGFALVVFFLLAYWLIELKPETSADALSMHLALPMAVAHDHRWAFDFHQYTWALIPSAGDCIFTATYLLGGETAARLTNLGLLVLIVAMVYQASRQWLAAALFASTPLVFLVTGSLFVENVWAAMILGAVLALIRYGDNGKPSEIRTAGVLFGSALATKVIAAVFLAPAALVAVWWTLRRKQFSSLVTASALLVVFAVSPYAYAWIKSGNPLFPFANAVFRSPYYPAESFSDPRFATPISRHAAYDVTFRSGIYVEGQGGASGFQYFLLLVPAVILIRRRGLALAAAIGGIGAILVLASVPGLRYLYPALPLLSIALGDLISAWRYAPAGFCALAALNAWFLASAGWYQKDFALYRPSQVPAYLESAAPERVLIDRLNRTAPGEPVAFFSTGAVAGLDAKPFTDSWHTYDYWTSIQSRQRSKEVAAILRHLGIHHIVAPVSLESYYPLFEAFLREWAEPAGVKAGSMGLFTLRDAPAMQAPFFPGVYDDRDSRIEYTGTWIHDLQFAKAANSSLTYCNVPGASLRLEFIGTGITYVFTKALNRGIAQVLIDGTERAGVDMYSKETAWRSEQAFDSLPTGKHTFEVRVLNEKNPASSGNYVDLDSITIK
jgi:hypothetical protein